MYSKLSFAVLCDLSLFATFFLLSSSFRDLYKNGFPFSKHSSCQATHSETFFKYKRCSKRLFGSLCWRWEQNEAICDPGTILEPAIIPRVAKSSWRRIWIQSSNGSSNYSLPRRLLHRSYFSLECLMMSIETDRLQSLTKLIVAIFLGRKCQYLVNIFPWGPTSPGMMQMNCFAISLPWIFFDWKLFSLESDTESLSCSWYTFLFGIAAIAKTPA